jgi:hypothetical protein
MESGRKLRLNVWCIINKIKACYSKEVRRVRKYQSGNQNQYKLGYMRGLVFNYMVLLKRADDTKVWTIYYSKIKNNLFCHGVW